MDITTHVASMIKLSALIRCGKSQKSYICAIFGEFFMWNKNQAKGFLDPYWLTDQTQIAKITSESIISF